VKWLAHNMSLHHLFVKFLSFLLFPEYSFLSFSHLWVFLCNTVSLVKWTIKNLRDDEKSWDHYFLQNFLLFLLFPEYSFPFFFTSLSLFIQYCIIGRMNDRLRICEIMKSLRTIILSKLHSFSFILRVFFPFFFTPVSLFLLYYLWLAKWIVKNSDLMKSDSTTIFCKTSLFLFHFILRVFLSFLFHTCESFLLYFLLY